MKLAIQFRKQTFDVEVADNATLLDLKKAVAPKAKLSIHRLRFKLGEVGLGANDKKLSDDGVHNGSTLVLRDLGLQIGYRTVFVVEYAGPLFIMLLYYLRLSILYFNNSKINAAYSDVALLGVYCWVAHFVKRELETFFVHKFSNPTMPIFNIIKNSMYYWSFGALCGYFLCHPLYTPPTNPVQIYTGLGIFVVSEIGNLICHLMLAGLRAAEGSTQRPIPKGFLFNLVSCPNYFFEVSAWVGFSIMTNLAFSWLFTLVGFLQMFAWAVKKHKGYLRSYGEEYKKLGRKAMVPFLM